MRPSGMGKTGDEYSWSFAPRFRRVAFGWRSDPAIARIKEATLTQIRNMLEGFPQERLVKGALARAAGLWDAGQGD
jgi:hypothetical protein